ncbi:MAG: hypothetical protein KatS3mg095_0439 [Candidatus Parcubacteria bacterium]|nr:MAG: hypothetical protein KatS3mg095_0439 [Candidatus Parcubacteria bacterium]
MVRILEKINKLEKELENLKLSLNPKIDFGVDEKVWNKVKRYVKESRKKIYKLTYEK